MMKYRLTGLIVVGVCLAAICCAMGASKGAKSRAGTQRNEKREARPQAPRVQPPQLTHADEKYGEHPKQAFDLYLVPSEIDWIEENKNGAEKVYSHDLIAAEALKFVRANQDRPFFLYVPFTIPHVALMVPEDSLAEYQDLEPDPPYDGKRGYVAHPRPRACYAGMVTRMDKSVGQIMDLLKELGLDDNTLVFFASDNGPTTAGGSEAGFFESAGPLHGLKGSVWEGGVRIPFIVRWPGQIKPGSESDHIGAFWDFLPTCAELLGEQPPKGIDGISLLPTLLARPGQKEHEYLYWELNGQQGVRMGDWKAVRLKPDQKIQLFNLKTDLGEQNDVADQHPEIVARMRDILTNGRTESEVFPLQRAGANANTKSKNKTDKNKSKAKKKDKE